MGMSLDTCKLQKIEDYGIPPANLSARSSESRPSVEAVQRGSEGAAHTRTTPLRFVPAA
jgi:hypothetical protein